jgi:hypothetical protein
MDTKTIQTNSRQYQQVMFLLFGVNLITICILCGVFYVFGFNAGLMYNDTHVLNTEFSAYKIKPVNEAMIEFVEQKLEKENKTFEYMFLSN